MSWSCNNIVNKKLSNFIYGTCFKTRSNGGGSEIGINLIVGGVSVGSDNNYKDNRPSGYILLRVSAGLGIEVGSHKWVAETMVY